MKVLHVQKVRGIAGSENYLFQALPALKAAGVELELAALVDGDDRVNEPFHSRMAALGVRVHVVPIGAMPSPSSVRSLQRLVRDGRFDAVHSHLVHADLFMSVALATIPRVALISTKHGYDEPYTNRFGFGVDPRIVGRYYAACVIAERRVDRSIAISEGLRRLFVGSGISAAARIRVVHYGFDLPGVGPDADLGGKRFGDPQLALVGRLVGFKGHRLALEALERLRLGYPGIRLVIVGSGPLEAELRDRVAKARLDEHVVFVGYSPKAREYMAASDVVLVPSLAEGFGVVFLEAFSVGRPVVAFDVPAANEIVRSGESGLLARPRDVDDYARNVERVLAEPGLGQRLAAGATARLQEYFTLERMTRQTIEVYEDALAARRARYPSGPRVAAP